MDSEIKRFKFSASKILCSRFLTYKDEFLLKIPCDLRALCGERPVTH